MGTSVELIADSATRYPFPSPSQSQSQSAVIHQPSAISHQLSAVTKVAWRQF